MQRFWKWLWGLFKDAKYAPPEPKLTVIVPGNYRQFQNWCHTHGLQPRDRQRVLCVLETQQRKLLGISGGQVKHVRFIGTWRDRKDLAEVRARIYMLQDQNTDITVTYYPREW